MPTTKLVELKLRLFAIGLSVSLGIIISIIAVCFFQSVSFFKSVVAATSDNIKSYKAGLQSLSWG